MSLDRSLKMSSGLARHRNVLTRAERVAKLSGLGKFDTKTGSPLGLVKVANRKVAAGGKPAAKKEAAAGAEGAAAAPAAAGAAPAAGKGAAPAAKGAAPAPAAKAAAGKGKK